MSLPPAEVPTGAIRFNSDSYKLEYFNGSVWMQVHTSSPDLSGQWGITDTAHTTPSGGDNHLGSRGFYCGSNVSNAPALGQGCTEEIEYVNFSSMGNTIDFGDLVIPVRYAGAGSSSTRAILLSGIGVATSGSTHIQYFEMATKGDSIDSGGDVVAARYGGSGFSNQTRGLLVGGYSGPANTNVLEYMTIASLGTDSQDFGDLRAGWNYRYPLGACASSTRGITAGGYSEISPGGSVMNIDYITITTLGDSQDFGDLIEKTRGGCGAVSSTTRGVFAGGYVPSNINMSTIQYITIASTGNSQDFGDLGAVARLGAACGTTTRGVYSHGGYPSATNTLEYINISTLGDATNFGDITSNGGDSGVMQSMSNAHGGL